jgi:DNA-binding NarL/FixJ family response regulator
MRILIADDHPLFTEALQILIKRQIPESSLTIVADLDAAHRALAAADDYDLAILDLYMPGGQGVSGVEQTLSRFPGLKLVVISGAATPAEVSRTLQLGAKGFLPKTLTPSVFAAALQVVASGGTYVPSEYLQVTEENSPASQQRGLTPRESQVLALVASGHANKEIGRALQLQEITVKLHLRNIFRKLGVRNRVEAAIAAQRLKITTNGIGTG